MLLEHSAPGQPLNGFTDNYLRVEADMPASADNTVVRLHLDSLCDDGETLRASLR